MYLSQTVFLYIAIQMMILIIGFFLYVIESFSKYRNDADKSNNIKN